MDKRPSPACCATLADFGGLQRQSRDSEHGLARLAGPQGGIQTIPCLSLAAQKTSMASHQVPWRLPATA